MSRTAFIFPGQGSQFVGMGRALADSHLSVSERFERANEILGFSFTETMFGTGGDPDQETAELKKTENTQPALFIHSAAATALLKSADVLPSMTAGHSLGEYSALFAAGAIEFEDGLRVVRRRGELMGRAGTERPGTMAAILGLDDDVVESICREASSDSGIVVPANYNSPGQIVISGDIGAVEQAAELASEAGARRALLLPVSGAFHSPLMEHAQEGLREVLETLNIQEPKCPVYMNVTAQATSNPDEIRTRLAEQLTAPVRWSQTLEKMFESGATRFVEVGAGKVLSGLVKRTLGRQTETAQAGTSEEIAALVQSPTTTDA